MGGGAADPEAAWERRRPVIDVDRAELAERLRPVVGGAPLESVTPLPGGLINTNLRVRCGGRDWVVRHYAREGVQAREVALLRRLRGQVPVAEVVHEGDGFIVQRFVAGRRLVDALPRASDATGLGRAAGEVLARIHGAIAFEASGLLDDRLAVEEPFEGGAGASWGRWIRGWLAGRASERLGPWVTAALSGFLDDHAARIDAAPGPVLCHADYKPTNLLVDASGAIAAVLDWEFALAGSPLLDLGQLIRWADRYPPGFAAGVEAGYLCARPLPADALELAAMFDLLNLVQLLDRADHAPRCFADARERVERTLLRLG